MYPKTLFTVAICLGISHISGVLSHPQTNSNPPYEKESWKKLHDAIESGNENQFEQLLLNGVDVNAVDEPTGNTALVLAVSKGSEEMVEKLIEKGASVNAVDKDKNSALILAAWKGHEAIVRLLIENDANVNLVNRKNDTALIKALSRGFDKIAELLIQKGADVNILGEYDTALNFAAQKGFEKIVHELIRNGANVNLTNKYHESALNFAAGRGDEEIVRLLIENGANVNVVDDYNNTALILALVGEYESIADLLIRKGARVDVLENYGKTALIWAAEDGYLKIVHDLIQKGANVNVVDEYNNSALISAALEGYEDIVRLLIENGANVNIANNYNTTALTAAFRREHESVAKLLIENGADIINVRDSNDDTMLNLAIKKGYEEIAEILINSADVNIVNIAGQFGKTPLMLAASKGNEKIIRMLLAKNATEVNAVDTDGHTALDAINTDFEGHEKLIQLMEQHGAEYKGVEHYRRTSHKACRLYTNLTARWQSGTRVFDGSLAEIGEFPWMVALGYLSKQFKISFQCGGSLVSDTFVLTAAHCVKSIQRPVIARMGKISLSDEDDFRAENQNIQEIIPHPKYSLRSKKNDIALIRLVDRISFSEFIQPICLQTDLADVDARINLVVTGWGRTNGRHPSTELLKIDLRTMPLLECNTNLLDYNKRRNLPSFRSGIDRSQYCAHDPFGKKDSCQGDSGGPLQTLQSYSSPAKVVGIVSFGVGCGRGRPGIYTRVAHYIIWIGSHVWPNGKVDIPRININDV